MDLCDDERDSATADILEKDSASADTNGDDEATFGKKRKNENDSDKVLTGF